MRPRLRCLSWLVILASTSFGSLLRAQTPPAQMQLFLLMGQSNMAGRGPVTAQDTVTHPRIWKLNQGYTWELAKDPLHWDRANAGVGLASQFARDLVAADPNIVIGLIPTAVGGSSINEWAPGTAYYANAVARAQTAMANGTLAGILWHQGEADATTAGASTYLQKLSTLMGQLRIDLGAPTVPIVAGELGPWRTAHSTLNPTLAQIPRHIPLAGFATSENLNHIGDTLHFDTPSLYELGHRYVLQYAEVDSALNFEAENLAYTLTGGARVAGAEVQASSGSFIRFDPTAFGQSINLTLPAVPAGTYAVKFRYRAHTKRGRSTVALDGVTLGGEIDQYAATAHSYEVTLGTVTFANAGSHVVRVTATSSRTSYKAVSIDSIVLVPELSPPPPPAQPVKFEAEGLARAVTGGTTEVHKDSKASGGNWLKFLPGSIGQSITFTLPSVPAGTYAVKYRYKATWDRGRGTVALDGVPLGGEIEQYQSTAEFKEVMLGNVTWTTAGQHTVRVTSTGSSSGYAYLSMDAFTLEPQTGTPPPPPPPADPILFQAETLSRSLEGGTIEIHRDSKASGGNWLKFLPASIGQSITLTLPSVPAGTYVVKYRYKATWDRGRGTVALDGVPLGGEIEQYQSTAEFKEVTLGNVTWTTAGNRTVRVTSTGSATGYAYLSMDAFTLVPQP